MLYYSVAESHNVNVTLGRYEELYSRLQLELSHNAGITFSLYLRLSS